MSDWDSNWFYWKVPSEQVANVWGKGSYPLRSTMTLLEYLTDAPFECGLGDTNVAAFFEATLIIGGCDAMEFLACAIWPLSEKCEFEVEMKETPLLKVMMPMPKVTPTIGNKESDAAFEAWIVVAANLLVSNYNVAEHNAYTRLRHGQLNRVFEFVGVLCQPHPKPIAHGPRKQNGATVV
jgi:hypothetical protein